MQFSHKTLFTTPLYQNWLNLFVSGHITSLYSCKKGGILSGCIKNDTKKCKNLNSLTKQMHLKESQSISCHSLSRPRPFNPQMVFFARRRYAHKNRIEENFCGRTVDVFGQDVFLLRCLQVPNVNFSIGTAAKYKVWVRCEATLNWLIARIIVAWKISKKFVRKYFFL